MFSTPANPQHKQVNNVPPFTSAEEGKHGGRTI